MSVLRKKVVDSHENKTKKEWEGKSVKETYQKPADDQTTKN